MASALFEEVGDVIAAEGVELAGGFEGVGEGLAVMHFGEGEDFFEVEMGVKGLFEEAAIEGFGVGGEGEEEVEDFLIVGLTALLEERALVIGVEEVLIFLVGAGMLGDESVAAEKAQVIGSGVESEVGAGGILGGDAVAIGLEGDAELAGRAGGLNAGAVVVMNGEGAQVFFLGGEEGDGLFFGVGVEADVGDGVHPGTGVTVEFGEGGDVESVEKVALDVADPVFDTAFFLGLADVAGLNGEVVMGGEIGLAGMGDGGAVKGMGEDGGFAVVDDDFFGDAAEIGEGVFLGGEEVFGALAEGEFDGEHAAVTEDGDEGVEAALAVADGDGADGGEIDLGGFAGSERKGEESGLF